MEVEEITEIERVHGELHYLRRYSATLKYSLPQKKDLEVKIHFSLESDAIGNNKIKLEFLSPVDYPLIPAQKKVLEAITVYDRKGKLQ